MQFKLSRLKNCLKIFNKRVKVKITLLINVKHNEYQRILVFRNFLNLNLTICLNSFKVTFKKV